MTAMILIAILLIMAALLFLGMMGEKEAANKKIYCCAFMVCVAAITAITVVEKLI